MTQKVKECNTVVLSGEGADELFFGYNRIFKWAANNRWNLKDFDKQYSYGSNDDLEIVEDAVSPFMCFGRTIDIIAAFFQVAHLHGLLRRLDNATMFSSVEARVPFLDYRLIERMAGVSFDYRMAGGVVKAPLKRIFCNLVPKEILAREKVGFPVRLESLPLGDGVSGKTPMDKWLQFNLKELIGDSLPKELE
jgi:asparagine synthase (glutamine-hydrolysing)